LTEQISKTVIDLDIDPIFQKLIEKNPELVKKFRRKSSKFALSEQMRTELLDKAEAINHKHFAMIKTQLECGLRVGELVNLTIPQVNLTSKLIEIRCIEKSRYCEEWHPKTTSGQRTLPITPELVKVLRKIIDKRKEGYVFESRKGHSKLCEITVISMINGYARECKSISKNIGSHALRRTYASYLIRDGLPIGDVSKALGHKDIKTTMIYLWNVVDIESLDDIRDSIAKMNPKKDDDVDE
jgi:integrase